MNLDLYEEVEHHLFHFFPCRAEKAGIPVTVFDPPDYKADLFDQTPSDG